MEPYRSAMLREVERVLGLLDEEQVSRTVEQLLSARRIFCDGLGRSGLVMSGFAMRLAQMGLACTRVGEATAPPLGQGDVLLLCTASGASPVLAHHARRARDSGGKVVVLTGEPRSALAEEADGLLWLQAPNKDQQDQAASIQPMGSLFEQCALLTCDLMSLLMARQMGLSMEDMRRGHANIE